MEWSELAILVGLALVDSTSVGTLVVPILLVLGAGSVRLRPMATYLATVVVFYFLVGVLLLQGAGAVIGAVGDRVGDDALQVGQVVLGVVLVLGAVVLGRRRPEPEGPNRWERMAGSSRAMVPLALSATVVELTTMFPYLGAIGLLTASDLSTPASLGVLLGYCVVMVLPAIVILVVAAFLLDRLREPLARFAAWIQKETRETGSWLLGFIGVVLVVDVVGPSIGISIG